MATVTTDPTPLYESLAGAFEAATDQVLGAVKSKQHKRTGALAASYQLSSISDDGGTWATAVTSPLPYAMPVERGAYLRGRRGPHMKGNSIVKRTGNAVFGAAMRSAIPAGYKPRKTTVRAYPEKLG